MARLGAKQVNHRDAEAQRKRQTRSSSKDREPDWRPAGLNFRDPFRLLFCLCLLLCASVSLWLTGLLEELDGVAEQLQPVAFLLEPLAGPARVLGRQDVSFGVRH